MKNQGSVVIDRPIDQVFDLTNKDVAVWSITVVEDRIVEDKNGGGVGTTFHIVTEEKGNRMDFDGVITAWEPPTFSAIQLTGKMFDIYAEYTFEDLGGRTRVTQSARVEGKGLTNVMFFLFGWLMKKSSCDATTNELESLKQYCEGQPGHA